MSHLRGGAQHLWGISFMFVFPCFFQHLVFASLFGSFLPSAILCGLTVKHNEPWSSLTSPVAPDSALCHSWRPTPKCCILNWDCISGISMLFQHALGTKVCHCCCTGNEIRPQISCYVNLSIIVRKKKHPGIWWQAVTFKWHLNFSLLGIHSCNLFKQSSPHNVYDCDNYIVFEFQPIGEDEGSLCDSESYPGLQSSTIRQRSLRSLSEGLCMSFSTYCCVSFILCNNTSADFSWNMDRWMDGCIVFICKTSSLFSDPLLKQAACQSVLSSNVWCI